MMKKYQIADFIFGIHMEESLEIPENFKKFVIDTDEEVQVELVSQRRQDCGRSIGKQELSMVIELY